ncbi:MAG TPA: biotin carboxylase N-terminal domain-containing protein [Bacteroidales bacterium]|nr:biotin carboxylase N-terminal domain-containing protein [Bacteroidales bacterium]
MFRRILVANRGEIAVRIIKTLRKMSIGSVAVYAAPDAGSLHTRLADQACFLDGDQLTDTYLNISKIIEFAHQTGCDAIHPGYGFLSENANFADAVEKAGITFIGPPAGVIRRMGDKAKARMAVAGIGVPLLEGIEGKPAGLAKMMQTRKDLFPVMIKASAGGGGKAMRKASDMQELLEAIEISAREAMNYFGNPELCIEKFYPDARHIEIQVLADKHGKVVIPGERECTVQRRYQKVIEESPSDFLQDATRRKMFQASLRIARELGYENAGTIEYLVDDNQNFFFLEMNTRIQVEHPVTEMVTGLDIVEQQILIAAGNPLALQEGNITSQGHAVEARLYAEDPCEHFLPSPGEITTYHEPSFPGLRIDSSMDGRTQLHPGYDPMIAKIITYGSDRDEAVQNLRKALENFVIGGTRTNRAFLFELLQDDDFVSDRISTSWLEHARERIAGHLSENMKQIDRETIFALWLTRYLFKATPVRTTDLVWQKIGYWRQLIKKPVFYEGRQFDLYVVDKHKDGFVFECEGKEFRVRLRNMSGDSLIIDLDGQWVSGTVTSGYDIEDIVLTRGYDFRLKPLDYLPSQPFIVESKESGRGGKRIIKSPLHGKIIKLNAERGKKVLKGELLFILDAMKIENKIISPFDGLIKEVRVNTGDQVELNQPVLVIE